MSRGQTQLPDGPFRLEAKQRQRLPVKTIWLARRQTKVAGLISAALLLTSCAAIPLPPAPAPEPARPAASAVPDASGSKTFGLAWESVVTQDGELTGIESSIDLIHWQVETQWTLICDWPASVIVSNVWHDTKPRAAEKFYRAFNASGE